MGRIEIGTSGIIVRFTHLEACEILSYAKMSYEKMCECVYSKISIQLNRDSKRKIDRLCEGVYAHRDELWAMNENSRAQGITIYADENGTYRSAIPNGIGRSPCAGTIVIKRRSRMDDDDMLKGRGNIVVK